MDSAIADFLDAMAGAGVVPDEPIAARLATGTLIRFRCRGDRAGRQNGWAVFHADARPAGAYGHYRLGTGTLKWKSGKWKSGSTAPALSRAGREALSRQHRATEAARAAERANTEHHTAIEAARRWHAAPPASPDHGYIVRKAIDPAPLRQSGDALYVPLCDATGRVWNLQTIRPCGTKRFLKGGRTAGLFALVGACPPTPGRLVLAEGYATADALHRALGLPVVAAFSAANLTRVARIWAEGRPDLAMTVFADDDAATASATGRNPGREAAEAAARAVGAAVAYPGDGISGDGISA